MITTCCQLGCWGRPEVRGPSGATTPALTSKGVLCRLDSPLGTAVVNEEQLKANADKERLLRFLISSPQDHIPPAVSSYYYRPSQRGYCPKHWREQNQERAFSCDSELSTEDGSAMIEPASSSSDLIQRQRLQQQQQFQRRVQPPSQHNKPPPPVGVPLSRPGASYLAHLSVDQLEEMARRQQQQIDAQQHMLVAKEQRLKYLRQQDMRNHQMAAEYERLRRLREKVEAQELKLRKLRALRGQNAGAQSHQYPNANQGGPNQVVLADLESIRSVFNDKEKELAVAVRKVEELTQQLDDLRAGRISNKNAAYPPQLVELERLRRELAYRKQLNEQQNHMISQQRAQLARGQDEMMKIDNRILELQDRLARKRMMNQQLASQINAATSAKQAQLRAIQQGMSKNKNKPVSTVEPFQRQLSPDQFEEVHLKHHPSDDPKYQTLPFGTKFGPNNKNVPEQMNKTGKENNNQFGNHSQAHNNLNARFQSEPNLQKPVSSVPPVLTSTSSPASTSQLPHANHYEENGGTGSSSKPKPALPPKPLVSKNGSPPAQPPPYVPAPRPDTSGRAGSTSTEAMEDSSITIRDAQSVQPNTLNLSVSAAHPEEGTSVDDDPPSPSAVEDPARGGAIPRTTAGLSLNLNSNVHISINRRIEMPPAFHFPEDQTPPSDLLGPEFSKDMADNSAMFPMINQIYKDFDNLSLEEKHQLFAKTFEEEDSSAQQVPEFESDHEDESAKPPGIIKRTNLKGQDNSTSHNRHVCFDPLALLLDASLEGELELVKKTAREVPDPSAANDEGITALHNSICAGHFDIVKFLVEFGCDVNAQDSDGWTPLHCAASCNNLPMVRFLVEHGACIFATTFSDQETAAEKCEEDEEGYAGCSEYLYSVQDKLGVVNNGKVFALYDYHKSNPDELSFEAGDAIVVVRKNDEVEKEWWWAKKDEEGFVPRNFFGMYPRVLPQASSQLHNGTSSMSEDSDASSPESSKSTAHEESKRVLKDSEDRGHSSA